MKVGILHTAFIGDLALTGLLIDGLARAGHEVILFTNKAGSLLYRGNPRLASVQEIRKGKGLGKALAVFEIAKRIDACSLDALVVPHGSFTSAAIASASGITNSFGYASLHGALAYGRTRKLDTGLPRGIDHLLLAADALIPPDVIEGLCREPWGYLLDQRLPEAFLARWPRFAVPGVDPYFAVFPGSVWDTKKIPPTVLAPALATLLEKNPALTCVISGGPADAGDAAALFAAIPRGLAERALVALSEVPLPELPAFLRLARFAITNDSGPMHVASGVNCPVVAVYGPTPWNTGMTPTSRRNAVVRWRPGDSGGAATLPCQPCSPHGPRVCPRGHHRCMKDLRPSAILDAVSSVAPDILI